MAETEKKLERWNKKCCSNAANPLKPSAPTKNAAKEPNL